MLFLLFQIFTDAGYGMQNFFSLVGCAVYGFIHRTIYILLLCKLIIKINKIAHSRHVQASAKIIIARGPYTTKKRSHMGAFFRTQYGHNKKFLSDIFRTHFDLVLIFPDDYR